MLSYLQKFNNLETSLREKVSGVNAMVAIEDLEKKYNVSLATVVMRVMVRDISLLDLSKFFMFEFDLEARKAEDLVEEMKVGIFKEAASYLGFSLDNPGTKKEGLSDWMDKQKQASQIRTSDFFFSPEDEAEVKALAQRLEGYKEEKKQEEQAQLQNLKEIVEEIVKRVNIKFSSDEILERFKQILITHVKGVRSKIDTKETLMKDVESGGLDLNDELSSRILSIAEKVKVEFKERPPKKEKIIKQDKKTETPVKEKLKMAEGAENKKESASSLGMRDVEYDFNELRRKSKEMLEQTYVKKPEEKNKVENPSEQIEEIELKDTEAKTLEEINARIEETSPRTEKNQVYEFPEQEEKSRPAQATPLNVPPKTSKSTVSGKVKMEDVKFVPKLTGPVDELREMSFLDFRRLGAGALDSAKKIVEKIEFLEKDSYKKRLEGIKAWRESPINKTYLSIGQKSIGRNVSINDLISEKLSNDKEFMTVDEFSAVMELNKKLRF